MDKKDKKDKKTNNDPQNTTQKTIDWSTRTKNWGWTHVSWKGK